jgi:hypothetical protein
MSYSNYPDDMSNFDHDPRSPEYTPYNRPDEPEYEHEDWMREGDYMREDDADRESDYERF